MIDDNGLEQDQKDEVIGDIEDISDVQLEQTSENNSTAHDDFDWSLGKRNTFKYSDTEHKKYFEQYDQSLNSVSELEVVKGRVTSIHSGDREEVACQGCGEDRQPIQQLSRGNCGELAKSIPVQPETADT